MLMLLIRGYLHQLIQLITLLNTFYNLSIPMVRVRSTGGSPSSPERAAAGGPDGHVCGPMDCGIICMLQGVPTYPKLSLICCLLS